MNDKQLRQVVGNVLGVDSDTLTDESSPDTISGWDSLKTMDLLLAIEQVFDVRLTDDQIESLTSFALIRLAVAEALVEARG